MSAVNIATNSWSAGPNVPGGFGADDAPGAILPNGHVLFTADIPLFHSPTHMFEFDPTTGRPSSACLIER